jgi:uncharacterized protein YndB with AHSA1/START domain
VIRVEHTLEIDRPAEDVFDYLTAVEHLPEWQASALEVQAEREVGVGTHIHEVRKFLGRRVESTLEVTAYERPRRFDLRTLSGPVAFQVRHTLEDVAGRTRLTFRGEGETRGFFKLAEPVVARTAERQFIGDLETLKDVLEASQA